MSGLRSIPSDGASSRLLSNPSTWSVSRFSSQSIDIPFPKLTVKVQPAGRTLVNLDTIVYTDRARSDNADIRMLGYPVTVVGQPVSYTWHFGDGTPDVTTQTPGSPYPAEGDHPQYPAARRVELSVTVNYAAASTSPAAGWQSIRRHFAGHRPRHAPAGSGGCACVGGSAQLVEDRSQVVGQVGVGFAGGAGEG